MMGPILDTKEVEQGGGEWKWNGTGGLDSRLLCLAVEHPRLP